MNRNLVRALLLAGLALSFGAGSFRYSIGDLSDAGPGLFPLMISTLLLIVSIMMIVRSRYEAAVPLQIGWRRISLVLGGLIGFVLVSKAVGVLAGIVALVFITALAGTSYSWRRNLQVSLALIVVAFAMQSLLGLNIGLY